MSVSSMNAGDRQRPETLHAPGLELQNVMLGTELESSGREIHSLNC